MNWCPSLVQDIPEQNIGLSEGRTCSSCEHYTWKALTDVHRPKDNTAKYFKKTCSIDDANDAEDAAGGAVNCEVSRDWRFQPPNTLLKREGLQLAEASFCDLARRPTLPFVKRTFIAFQKNSENCSVQAKTWQHRVIGNAAWAWKHPVHGSTCTYRGTGTTRSQAEQHLTKLLKSKSWQQQRQTSWNNL